ncbi:hypothetical protein [Desulfatiglans anilini]|uniref:IS66 family transposase n=1 Tax=Desulfatiglans anilini TaxID=90728 RepID=UPI0003F70A68|nr:hypothetical protein [Desulfatiglans anilini]
MVSSLHEAIALIQEKDLQIQKLTKQLRSRDLSLRTLQNQVEQLLRRVYGRRSEKMHPDQLMFGSLLMETAGQPATIEPLAEVPPSTAPRKPKASKHNHPGRLPIPEHLKRVEIVLDIPEEEKCCPQTGKPLKEIGCEVSQKLEYRPSP